MGCRSHFYEISLVVLQYFYGISKGCPWNFNAIPVGFARSVSRVSIGSLCDFFGSPKGIP